MALLLLLLSALVLSLEVLETKIFAYTLANNLITVVVGVALLGFGAGGTVLSLRRRLGDPRPLVHRSLLAMGALVVAAHAWFAIASPHLDFHADGWTVSVLALLASPYFAAGTAIAAILAEPHANVGRRYGFNLVGSALGCAVPFALLGPLTAPQCLVLCATGVALLGAFCGRAVLREGALVLAVGGVLMAFADHVFDYQPEPAASGGQLSLLQDNLQKALDNARQNEAGQHWQRAELVERFDRWDPTARVQVHDLVIESSDPEQQAALDALPNMWFTQDSSYGSPLIGVGPAASGFYERSCYGLGFFRGGRNQDVLIIGLGGAPDVQTALHYQPRSIVGVDINRTTVAMVRGPMSDFLGDPYADPRVDIVVRDGRSFVRGDDHLYDHIQLSGVDTKSVLAAGTLAVNESYLYTEPAFREYLRRLKPNGVLCILYAGEELMHRLAVTAMAALEDLGVTDAPDHLMLLQQSAIVAVLVKRTAFTAEECAQMDRWLAAARQPDGTTGVLVMVYELLVPGGGLSLLPVPQVRYMPDGRPTADPLMQAARRGTLPSFLEKLRDTQQIDLSPVDDDRPFFFHVATPEKVWNDPPEYFRRLFSTAAVMGVLALLLITGPLVVFRLRGLQVLRNLPLAVYFAGLGAGFVLAEIGLIQRYVLFLGHQSYAFPTVIGGLLVSAGVGSMLSSRWKHRPQRVIAVAVAVACVAIAGQQLGVDLLFGATASWPLGLRLLVGIAALVPLGVPLGMLFPTGLVLLERTSPVFVPWAFGINGVFSVLGSTLVVPGAILYGFPAMAATAALIYVVAALVAWPVARRLAV